MPDAADPSQAAADASNASSPAPQRRQPASGRASPKLLIAGVAVAIIAIVLIAAYLLLGSHIASVSRYALLAETLSSGKQVTLSKVLQLLNVSLIPSSAVNSSVNANYSGSGGASVVYSGINLNIPFRYTASEQANGSYSRTAIQLNTLGTNISGTYISTPSETLLCGNQNQSYSFLASAISGSGSSASPAEKPDYKCILSSFSRSPLASLNSSSMKTLNLLINYVGNNTYINASKTSYSTYKGSSCIYVAGHIHTNTINLGTLLASLYNSTSQNSSSASGDTFELSGPYSACVSPSSGAVYNFSVSIAANIEYKASSYSSSESNFNVSLSISGNATSIGAPEPYSFISNPPYPIINGTCSNQNLLIDPMNYQSSFSPYYYSCQSVDLNSTGGLRLVLSPEQNPYGSLYGNYSTPSAAQTSPARILGLACNSYQNAFLAPNASSYKPVNITVNQNSELTLIFSCPITPANKLEYSASLYIVTQQNGTSFNSYPGMNGTYSQSSNMSYFLTSITAFPTISGPLGRNANTGPVSSRVVLPQSPSYNYTFNFTTTIPYNAT